MLTLGVILGSLLLVALAELVAPRRRREFPALRRRFGNLGVWLLGIVLASFFAVPDADTRAALAQVTRVPAFSWPFADGILGVAAAFLLLDFFQYAMHRCEHAVPLLWRLHALHHTDPDVDVTTAVRHHPLELLVTAAAYWLFVLITGVPLAAVAVYSLALFATAALQHGNIRLPGWLDRALQPFLIMVDMHRIHHSVVFEQANANYGAVLSVWDRMFGTLARLTPAEHDGIVFGVAELPRADGLKPTAMLLTPWRLGRAMRQARAAG